MFKWLDLIDQAKLNHLVNSYNLHLNNTTCSFLESFANLVNQASNTRRKLLEAANLRKAHLHTVNSIVAHELFHLRKQLPHLHIIPYRHPETSLPIVYVRIHQFPDLVVHVFRSYATNNYGLTFGFRAYSFCRGPLTGPFASAANYLRARCTAKSWNISLSELISVWCHHVATIPVQQLSPSLPSPNKSRKMIRRRRRANRSPSPPAEHQNTFQSSLPHDHPNTDVIIKDDRLFPNREFHDPEELYAEQVRAIRNKRKHPSGIIYDDAELAWKKLRHSPSQQPPDEQSHPAEQQHVQQPPASPPPHAPPSSPPKSPPPQPESDSPVEPAAPVPSLTKPVEPPLQPQLVSPEDSDDAFINPLSPEPKHESLPEETQVLDDTGNTPRGEEGTPAPKPKPPSPTRQAEADPPSPAHVDDDDGSTQVFSFSTAVLPDAFTPSNEAPAPDSPMERVREDSVEESGLEPTRSEQAEETCPAVLGPSREPVQVRPTSDFGDGGSGEQLIAKPALSLPEKEVDQGSQENDCGTPTTLQNDANSISPQGSTPLGPGLDKELPEDLDDAYELRNDDLDRTRARPHEANASPPIDEEKLEKDSASMGTGRSKKRPRARECEADVIVVDPDSDEEPDDTNRGKKRRLSPTLDVQGPSATLSAERSTREAPVTAETGKKGDVPQKREKGPQQDAEIVIPISEERVTSQANEANDPPIPRQEDSESIEKSGANGPVDTIEEGKEGTQIPALRPSSAKEVTRDVESSLIRYGGPSIPAGVDRDPCPMALSEPSDSSEGSSDDDSNSSFSSGARDADDERE